MNVEDRVLIKSLAKTAEVINTINGGMSQPKVRMTRNEQEWMLKLKVPGVSPENLKIEIKDNQMFIFQIIGSNNSVGIELPYLITSFIISPRVDMDSIMAEYEKGEIFVHMPFDELSDGHPREVEIIKK